MELSDKKFLLSIYFRLLNVYHEDTSSDFMKQLKKYIDNMKTDE